MKAWKLNKKIHQFYQQIIIYPHLVILEVIFPLNQRLKKKWKKKNEPL